MEKSNSIIKAVLISVLAVVISCITFICGCGSDRGEPPPEQNSSEASSIPEITFRRGNGISLAKSRLAADEYDDYGISPRATNAFTITATVYDTNGNAPDSIQQVTYLMSWSTSSTEELNDYMTMSVTGCKAVFMCLKAFPTQITVTCTSALDTTKTITATFEYAKRVTDVTALWNGQPINVGATLATTNTLEFLSEWAADGEWTKRGLNISGFAYDGVGTVNATVERVIVNVALSTTYKNALKALGEPWKTLVESSTTFTTTLTGSDINKTVTESDIYLGIFPTNTEWNTSGISDGFINAAHGITCFSLKLQVVADFGSIIKQCAIKVQ